MQKMLSELIALLPEAQCQETCEVAITGITQDSRQVRRGSLFICLPGSKVDGHDFAEKAIAEGAVALLAERPLAVSGAAVIVVPDVRKAMGRIVPFFYDRPTQKLRLLGVTGTNGKTTTTYLLKAILEAAGYRVGLIGTIQSLIGDEKVPTKNTTPDVVELQELMWRMAEAGMEYVVMEVSSHALALDRVAGCEFDMAMFTNMTQDHLDFHKTLGEYAEAKARLFSLASQAGSKIGKHAVINADDAAAEVMRNATDCDILTYGIENAKADLLAKEVQVTPEGARFMLQRKGEEWPVKLLLTGRFNVYNALGAIGAALSEGISWPVIQEALAVFAGVPGRFERVDGGKGFAVIVDYAHTPDGLENILRTAREMKPSRVVTVFGCGGDRDRTKRPLMGALAARYSDVVIATSDNPRSEEPESILNEIEAGILRELRPEVQYEKIVDRRQGIGRALELAQAGDIILVAGKGHENYQILKDKTIHFDDKEIIQEWLRQKEV
nr:UDP-N-acetylmuramoyl-L-alanyl-D-glutamate--2,6-diaminopimelate ligase [uncultured Anaeromusa sp.]